MNYEVWSNQHAVDALEDIIQQSATDLELAIARVPALFGQSYQATYLGYRSMGLDPEQAMRTLDLDLGVLNKWRTESPAFFDFELVALPGLQKDASVQLMRIGFLRNMALFMMKDHQIISKSMVRDGLEEMSDREFKYLTTVRKHYTPSDLLALEKAVSPEAHQDSVHIKLTWGEVNSEVINGEARLLQEGEYDELGDDEE